MDGQAVFFLPATARLYRTIQVFGYFFPGVQSQEVAHLSPQPCAIPSPLLPALGAELGSVPCSTHEKGRFFELKRQTHEIFPPPGPRASELFGRPIIRLHGFSRAA